MTKVAPTPVVERKAIGLFLDLDLLAKANAAAAANGVSRAAFIRQLILAAV